MILREIMVTINKYGTVQYKYIHTREYPVENPKPPQNPPLRDSISLHYLFIRMN